MNWRPEGKNQSCEECLNIAREINAAYEEAYLRNKPASDALRALIGGTEADATRADQVLSLYRFNPKPGVPALPEGLQAAMRRCALHCARTGHSFRPFLPK
ncbi:MAG TPA: hypothetical protein VJR23_14510 [Candidatus Acidoferrales bacterium]|nr:hypothetical protein [Candidatus Acidoferrales bacterium]